MSTGTMPNLSNGPTGGAHAEAIEPKPRILFVGLGTMGLPMASNLVRAAFPVEGHDIDAAAVAAFSRAGGEATMDIAAAAARASVIVTMLPDDAIVTRVLAPDAGLLAVARPGTLVIEMSTTSPSTKIELARLAQQRGIDFIECPVGKTMEHAVAGTLTLMAAGDIRWIDKARPVLLAMGNDLHICGDIGAGSAIKLINNALVACINAASIEALVVGTKANLDLETMINVFRTTMAWNNALALGLPRKALRRDFKPGFMTKLAHKDVRLALAMAQELGVPMKQGEAACDILEQALEDGFGGDDTSGSMLRVCESRGGVRLSL
jgi:4-hydroxybutyrate dehydrogenase/sulfolactaldehyde 3-reductase